MEEFKSVQNVVMYVGPKGVFHHLSYQYKSLDGISNSVSIESRNMHIK